MNPLALLPIFCFVASAADLLSLRMRGRPTAVVAPAAAGIALALAVAIVRGGPEALLGGVWWTGVGLGEFQVRLGQMADPRLLPILLLIALLGFLGRLLPASPDNLPRLSLASGSLMLLATADNLPMLFLAFLVPTGFALRGGRAALPPLAGAVVLAGGLVVAAGIWRTTNLADIAVAVSWGEPVSAMAAAAAATLILAAAALAIVAPLFTVKGAAGEPVARIAFPMIAGALLLVRLDPVVAVSPSAAAATLVAGLALFLVAPVAAFGRVGMRRAALLLACGQAGLVLAALGIGAFRPALAHLLTVPLAAVLLMLALGIAKDAAGEGGAGGGSGGGLAMMPATGRLLLAGAAAIAWVPPFAGFFSGAAIVDSFGGVPGAGPFLRAGACVGVILSAAAAARLSVLWLFGPPPLSVRGDPPLATLAVPAALALLLVAAGFVPVAEATGGSAPPGSGTIALLVAVGVAAGALSGRRRGEEGGRG